MRQSSVELLKKLHGKTGEDYGRMTEESHPEFAKLIDDFVLDKIWSRTGLPLKEKCLITLSSVAALGQWDQVELQMRSFLHLGGKIEELAEVFIHLAVYCGFPTAVSGMGILEKIKKETN